MTNNPGFPEDDQQGAPHFQAKRQPLGRSKRQIVVQEVSEKSHDLERRTRLAALLSDALSRRLAQEKPDGE